jgi:hypothetical protein
MCAATDPNCSKSYKEGKTPTTKTKAIAAVVPTKTRARAIAAVKTLTSPPKMAPTPAPAIAPTAVPAKVTATTPVVKTKTTKDKTKLFNVKAKYQKLVKHVSPEYADYFHYTDGEHDILNKIALLKKGIQFDKNADSKTLWGLTGGPAYSGKLSQNLR